MMTTRNALLFLICSLPFTYNALSSEDPPSSEEAEEKKKKDSPVSFSLETAFKVQQEEYANQTILSPAIKLKMTVDLGKDFKVVSVAQTGAHSNSGNALLKNFDDDGPQQELSMHIRQLHLQYGSPDSNFKAKFGSFGTEGTEGLVTAFYPHVFIDGGQFSLDTKFGEATVTMGSVGGENMLKPDFYERNFKHNYREVQFQRALWEEAQVEFAHERLDNEEFVRLILTQKFQKVLGQSFKVFLEMVYDQKRKAYKSGLSVKFNSLRMFGRTFPYRVSYSLVNQDEEYDHFRDRVSSFWTAWPLLHSPIFCSYQ